MNTWFKFEGKIPLTRNNTDDNDGTKNNMPPLHPGDIKFRKYVKMSRPITDVYKHTKSTKEDIMNEITWLS